jgi:hypothetical protein
MTKRIESAFEFVARYQVEQLERIERHGVELFLQFPDAVPLHPQQELAAGPILRVHPADGKPWIGVFRKGALGFPRGAPNRLIGWPDERSRCVVYAGGAVVVRTDEPALNYEIAAAPITDVLVVPDHELVVFADFTHLEAYGRDGLLWRADVASDEARIDRVEGNLLHGGGFYLGWNNAPFTVDLRDGTVSRSLG